MEIKKKELLYDGVYCDVTSWIKLHPGGNIIEFYTDTGEDSIHAVQQFHYRSSNKVMSIMKSLPHRTASQSDVLESDEKIKRNKILTSDFLELFEELKLEGLFKPAPLHVFLRMAELFFLYAVGCYSVYLGNRNGQYGPTIFGLAAFSLCAGRSGWLGHEAGHNSLTGIPKLDKVLISFIYGFYTGLSGSYWNRHHSRHHAMPQHVKYDIDLQTLPLLAFNKRAVKIPNDGKTLIIQNQKYLFMGINTLLVTLFWKLYLHPTYCFHKKQYMDLIFMGLHYSIIFLGGFRLYLIVIWLTGMYMFGNFALSHTHLPVTEEPTHWVEYSLTHTANIRSSWWVDYWMGNLNYQIEHHLFPTMPQFRNKLCRDRVKALAKKHNLPYNLYSYEEAMIKTWENLGTVSKELALL